ncbi:hypothetical protein MESS2_1710013 [Mesorhizobium metallidurans STM 2683]|uniref:Uncharacterized protein n=1 Tax=Mesorhizobium metallidurans STM 2683 TaxID=1297569 RepID=M5F294_9HYPH|nr:hypothetical protein MESS2_1710013 [Mesorhizobium metallidurans STM 2683]
MIQEIRAVPKVGRSVPLGPSVKDIIATHEALESNRNPSLSLRVLLFVPVLRMRSAWTAALPVATRRPPRFRPASGERRDWRAEAKRSMQDRSVPSSKRQAEAGAPMSSIPALWPSSV